MRNLRIKFLVTLLLGVLIFYSCTDSKSEESKNSLTEVTSEEIEDALKEIREKLFALDSVSSSEWALVLVGNHETVVSDLCGDSEDCAYSVDHFEILREGKNIFALLDPKTQGLISEANKFFAGDVTVYDVSNTARDKFLNDIDSDLGLHELALVKLDQITPLHSGGYGNNFWPDAVSDEKVEAFTETDPTALYTKTIDPYDDSDATMKEANDNCSEDTKRKSVYNSLNYFGSLNTYAFTAKIKLANISQVINWGKNGVYDSHRFTTFGDVSGYFGIQVQGGKETGKRGNLLFSVWDGTNDLAIPFIDSDLVDSSPCERHCNDCAADIGGSGTKCSQSIPINDGDEFEFTISQVQENGCISPQDVTWMSSEIDSHSNDLNDYCGGVWNVSVTNLKTDEEYDMGSILWENNTLGLKSLHYFHEQISCTACDTGYNEQTHHYLPNLTLCKNDSGIETDCPSFSSVFAGYDDSTCVLMNSSLEKDENGEFYFSNRTGPDIDAADPTEFSSEIDYYYDMTEYEESNGVIPTPLISSISESSSIKISFISTEYDDEFTDGDTSIFDGDYQLSTTGIDTTDYFDWEWTNENGYILKYSGSYWSFHDPDGKKRWTTRKSSNNYGYSLLGMLNGISTEFRGDYLNDTKERETYFNLELVD